MDLQDLLAMHDGEKWGDVPCDEGVKPDVMGFTDHHYEGAGHEEKEGVDIIEAPSAASQASLSTVEEKLCWSGQGLYGLHSIEQRDEHGRTALHKAVKRGDERACAWLLAQGADVNATYWCGKTALLDAAQNGFTSIVNSLLQHCVMVDYATRQGLTALMEACRKGHVDVVKLLLVAKASVDMCSNEGDSALIFAARSGHEPVCSLLLAAGADVNWTDGMQRTPLSWAASRGHLDVCALLTSHGAHIDTQDGKGLSPLMHAVREGHQEAVTHLLNCGAKLELKDHTGNTAFVWAVLQSDSGMCEVLMEAGANTLVRTRRGDTPVLHAIRLAKLGIVALLLGPVSCSLHFFRSHGKFSLLRALTQGKEDVCFKLLAAGFPTDIVDMFGRSALSIAASRGLAPICEALLRAGATIESLESRTRNPVVLAARNGHQTVVDMLVRYGATLPSIFEAAWMGWTWLVEKCLDDGVEVDVRDNHNRTPLIQAAYRGHTEVCRLLIARGASVEAEDNNGKTPLMRAARRGHKEACRLLVAAGAELLRMTYCCSYGQCGTTAFSEAVRSGDYAIVSFLKEEGGLTWEEIAEAHPIHGSMEELMDVERIGHLGSSLFLREHIPAIFILYAFAGRDQQGQCGDSVWMRIYDPGYAEMESLLNIADFTLTEENINHQNNAGETVLHKVAFAGDLARCQKFVAMGADVDIRTNSGETPLMMAACGGSPAVCDFLIQQGANPQERDGKQNSILHMLGSESHWSRLSSSQALDTLCSTLEATGLHFNCVNSNLHTPLMIAAFSGNVAVCEILLRGGASVDFTPVYDSSGADFSSEHGSIGEDNSPLSEIPVASASNVYQDTPLLFAARAGRVDVCQLLLESGANINLCNSLGMTALMEAAVAGHADVVEVLLRFQPDANLKNNEGDCALSFAAKRQSEAVCALLLQAGASYRDFTLPMAAATGDMSVVSTVLESSNTAVTDIKGRLGAEALYFAANARNADPDGTGSASSGFAMCFQLLELGANPIAAALIAVQRGSDGACDTLLALNQITTTSRVQLSSIFSESPDMEGQLPSPIGSSHDQGRLLLGYDTRLRDLTEEFLEQYAFVVEQCKVWECATELLSTLFSVPTELRESVVDAYFLELPVDADDMLRVDTMHNALRERHALGGTHHMDLTSQEALGQFDSLFVNQYHAIYHRPELPQDVRGVLSARIVAPQSFEIIFNDLLFVLSKLKRWGARNDARAYFRFQTAELGLYLFGGFDSTPDGQRIPTHAIDTVGGYGNFAKDGLPSAKALLAATYMMVRPKRSVVANFVTNWLLEQGANPVVWQRLRAELQQHLGVSAVTGQSSVALAVEADESKSWPLREAVTDFLLGRTNDLPLPVRSCGRLVRAWLQRRLKVYNEAFMPLVEALFMTMRGHNHKLLDPSENHSPACAQGGYLHLLNALGEVGSLESTVASQHTQAAMILSCTE